MSDDDVREAWLCAGPKERTLLVRIKGEFADPASVHLRMERAKALVERRLDAVQAEGWHVAYVDYLNVETVTLARANTWLLAGEP